MHEVSFIWLQLPALTYLQTRMCWYKYACIVKNSHEVISVLSRLNSAFYTHLHINWNIFVFHTHTHTQLLWKQMYRLVLFPCPISDLLIIYVILIWKNFECRTGRKFLLKGNNTCKKYVKYDERINRVAIDNNQ